MLKSINDYSSCHNCHKDRATEVIFTYKIPYGNEYVVSIGTVDSFAQKDLFEFESAEEIENLMLGLANMLTMIKRDNKGYLPR